MEWINQLKIAVIEKDENKIEQLISSLPQFTSLEEMESAAYLMQEAHHFLTDEKKRLAANLLNIKKQQEFLSNSKKHPSSFDTKH